MTEQTERTVPPLENHGPTAIEGLAWTVTAIGVAIWVVAVIIAATESGSFSGDATTALGWAALGQWIAGVSVVPAILLSGIRALLPDRRFG